MFLVGPYRSVIVQGCSMNASYKHSFACDKVEYMSLWTSIWNKRLMGFNLRRLPALFGHMPVNNTLKRLEQETRTVDKLARVMDNPLNRALFLQMGDRRTGQAPVDLEPLDEDALADETEGGHFLHDAVECGLVEDDGVLGLVFNFTLGPLLLLGSFSTRGRCCCFCFGLWKTKRVS